MYWTVLCCHSHLVFLHFVLLLSLHLVMILYLFLLVYGTFLYLSAACKVIKHRLICRKFSRGGSPLWCGRAEKVLNSYHHNTTLNSSQYRSQTIRTASNRSWTGCTSSEISCHVVGYKHLVRPTIREVVTLCTAQCKMLHFCVKTIDRFKLASLKKERRWRRRRGCLAVCRHSAWFGTFVMLYFTPRSLADIWWIVHCYKCINYM